MKKELSSKLTYLCKYIVPFLWMGAVVFSTIKVYQALSDARSFFLLLLFLPVLILLRPKFISYDNENLFISNGRTTTVFKLRQVKSINEPYNRFDPFFEIEIFGKGNEIEKYEFLAKVVDHLDWYYGEEPGGRIRELKNRIRQLHSLEHP